MEKKLGFSMEKNLFGFGPSLVVSKNAPLPGTCVQQVHNFLKDYPGTLPKIQEESVYCSVYSCLRFALVDERELDTLGYVGKEV